MALVYQLPFAVQAAVQPSVHASERAVYNHPRLRAWWDVRHDQALVSGGTIVDRKGGVVASLLDELRRPAETRIIGARFLVAGTSDSGSDATAPIAVTPAGIDLAGDSWTIYCVTGGPGNSALAAPWSIPGRNGNTISVRVRTSTRISVGLDTSGTAIVEKTDAAAAPHLSEVAYRQEDNRVSLWVDNANVGNAVATGWVQQTRRLALMGIWDEVSGPLAYGRGLSWSTVLVCDGYAPDWSGGDPGGNLRGLIAAMVADLYPAISLA